MGILRISSKINDKMLDKWASRLLDDSDDLVTKPYNNIFIDDMKFYLPENNNILLASKEKKIYGAGDCDFTKSIEHYLPKVSNIIYSYKWKKKYAGSGFIHDDISMNNLLVEKSIEEVNLKNSLRSLANSVKEFLGTKDAIECYIDFSKVKLEDLHELFNRHSLDTYSCAQIAHDYESLKASKDRLMAINHRIKIILNKIRQLGRSLKEHFTKNHSFHFKNLDDYHSLILVNSNIVS